MKKTLQNLINGMDEIQDFIDNNSEVRSTITEEYDSVKFYIELKLENEISYDEVKLFLHALSNLHAHLLQEHEWIKACNKMKKELNELKNSMYEIIYKEDEDGISNDIPF